jgi:hypothetical protein
MRPVAYLPALLVILALPIFSPCRCAADQVELRSGDVLNGTIKGKDADTLTIELTEEDTLEIPWGMVEMLKTTAPVTIMTTNGEVVIEPLSLTRNGDDDASTVHSVRKLSEVDLINPPDWKTGDAWHAKGIINLSISSQRGNAHTDDIDLDGRLTLRHTRHRVQLMADVENDRVEDVETDNKWLGRADYDNFVTDRTFGNLGVAFENNEAADLKLRSVARAGVGHTLWAEPIDKLEGKLLLNSITERYYNQSDKEYMAVGLEANFAEGVWNDTFIFYTDLDGTMAIDSSNRLLGKAWIGLRIPVSHGLVTSAEVKLEYDSEPADGANKTDQTFRIKLGYAW